MKLIISHLVFCSVSEDVSSSLGDSGSIKSSQVTTPVDEWGGGCGGENTRPHPHTFHAYEVELHVTTQSDIKM